VRRGGGGKTRKEKAEAGGTGNTDKEKNIKIFSEEWGREENGSRVNE